MYAMHVFESMNRAQTVGSSIVFARTNCLNGHFCHVCYRRRCRCVV